MKSLLIVCLFFYWLVTTEGFIRGKHALPRNVAFQPHVVARVLSKRAEQFESPVRTWKSSVQPLPRIIAEQADFSKLRRNEKANIIISEVAAGDTSRLVTLFRERSNDLSFLVTRALPSMKSATLVAFWTQVVLGNARFASALDLQAHCAAMTALIRLQHYELAVRTYEELLMRQHSVDSVTYICAMRAAGFCKDLPYIIQLLDKAFADVGDKYLDVAKTAIINLKYMQRNGKMDSNFGPEHAATCMRLAEALYVWVVDKGLQPDAQLMDSLLAVACVHGSDAECNAIQQRMSHWKIPPTSFTHNTLLDRCARLKDTAQATAVIRQMREQGIVADSTTYNTLLKLRVNLNDVTGAEKIAKFMEESPTIGVSAITQSLLFRLYRSNNITTAGQHSVETLLSADADSADQQAVSACVYATAIDACADASTGLLLLRRAQSRHLADTAVFLAAAKRLALESRYVEVFDIIHEMLFFDGLEMDKYTLSLIIRVSLDAIKVKQFENLGVASISKYVEHCLLKHPALLTRPVWNQLKDLLTMGHAEFFAELLTSAANASPAVLSSHVSATTLTAAFTALQDQIQQQVNADGSSVARTALTLLKALCWAHGQRTISVDNDAGVTVSYPVTAKKTVPLLTSHFNIVLHLLMIAHMFDAVSEVYHLMRGQYDFSQRHSADVSGASTSLGVAAVDASPPIPVATTWQPSTFTIAELVRCGRQSGGVGLLVGALAWAMEELVFIPLGVIGDVLSYLYSEGHSEAVAVLYKELYDRAHVNHWAAADNAISGSQTGAVTGDNALTMDLHGFTRAMAFAAIKTAVAEVKRRPAALASGEVLTIITGRNTEPERANALPATSGKGEYVLSNVVQEVLVEDFYPPISSSTVPGNPGRLQVKLCDL